MIRVRNTISRIDYKSHLIQDRLSTDVLGEVLPRTEGWQVRFVQVPLKLRLRDLLLLHPG